MLKRIDLSRDFEKHRKEYLEAIEEVCRETAFSGGRFADRFDEEFAAYCQVPYAAGVNNGTSALHCAMMALGIGEGDEVIVPANTYIATAWGVTYTGAVPVFVDCTSDTWEIDPDRIEERITEKTRAIIGVHLYGQPFEFNKVKAIADRHNLYVVEDCAQAHGAQYEGKLVGGLGELGCFSFYPGKNLYAFGEGGSVTCRKREYLDAVTTFKNQGNRVRYYHDVVGYNYRLEGIQGAVLSVSLKYLPEWTMRRRQIGARYLREITNPRLTMQAHPENTNPVFHLFVVTVEDPDHLIAYMEQRGMECNKHYPVPCHLQKAYEKLGYQRGDCPNAEYLADHCVTLPLFPEMTDEEVGMVIKACNDYMMPESKGNEYGQEEKR
jgi:dTDP-4-amino-4,6-dideoxygalactose transaminase